MSKFRKCFRAALLALAFAVVGYAPSASADVPASLTQQGRLLDDTGTVVDADVSFVFSIYAAATGGSALWSETQTITVDEGYFSARLGDVTAFPDTLFDGSKTLYLGVKVGSDAEMTPRQLITSVPFAIHAGEADHAAEADLATKATNAVNATHATTADTATAANSATTATTATTVTSISANVTEGTAASATTANAVIATCGAGYKAIAGGCNSNGQLMVSSFVKNQPAQYQCRCYASCTLTAQVVCAK